MFKDKLASLLKFSVVAPDAEIILVINMSLLH